MPDGEAMQHRGHPVSAQPSPVVHSVRVDWTESAAVALGRPFRHPLPPPCSPPLSPDTTLARSPSTERGISS